MAQSHFFSSTCRIEIKPILKRLHLYATDVADFQCVWLWLPYPNPFFSKLQRQLKPRTRVCVFLFFVVYLCQGKLWEWQFFSCAGKVSHNYLTCTVKKKKKNNCHTLSGLLKCSLSQLPSYARNEKSSRYLVTIQTAEENRFMPFPSV